MPYYIGTYRILTPVEVLQLYMAAEKPQSKAEFLYYVSTGARYNEGQYLLEKLSNFDAPNRVINFKSDKRWDRELIWKDRDIHLSYWDVVNVHNYIMTNQNHIINPFYANLTKNIKNWATRIGIAPKGVGTRCLRKTRFVWLLKAYPDYEDSIKQSMDYNPTGKSSLNMNDDAIQLYKNVPFTENEIKLTKALLFGWSGAPE